MFISFLKKKNSLKCGKKYKNKTAKIQANGKLLFIFGLML